MDTDLQADVDLARRGTEKFAHTLDTLDDAALGGASLLDGWTRSHVIAHVGYNARAITRLAGWARTGVESPMYESVAVRNSEIDEGARLSPTELRAFFSESAAQLDEAWNSLPADAWARPVRNGQGREVPASHIVWMRARELWVHSVDLAHGATFADAPADVVDRILRDVVDAWASRGDGAALVLTDTDSGHTLRLGGTGSDRAEIVSGQRAALVQWATGRGDAGVTSSAGQVRPAPRWL